MRYVVLVLALLLATPLWANEAEPSGSPVPNQEISNSKGFVGLNYDRQDSNQTGAQRIVNDHSAFNINIQIIKKGTLFKSANNPTGDLTENGGGNNEDK